MMDPIGTVTMYFPFMDETTREFIEDIMIQAQNYREFVSVLNDKVYSSENCTELEVFFATHHAAVLFDFDCLDNVAHKYGKLPIIRPNLFIASAFRGNKEDLEQAREAVDLVLASNPPDWLVCEMLVTKLEAELLNYPTKLYGDATLDSILSIFESNKNLDFFKSRLYDALGVRARRNGEMNQALQYYEMGIENASENNDLSRLALLFRSKASIVESTNTNESIDLLAKASSIMRTLGDSVGLGDVLFELSKLEAVRGRFDVAIDHCIDVCRLRDSVGMTIGTYALHLSTLYNVTGNPQAGLEWAKMAGFDLVHPYKPRAFLNQAWALCIMGLLHEATDILDDIRENILKSGLETHLAAYYLVNGISEKHGRNFSAAEVSLKGALDIYERRGTLMYTNICLEELSRIEVSRAEEDANEGHANAVSVWLCQLEERARTLDLPGILGQALLLKTRYLSLLNEEEEAEQALLELVQITQKSNLKFLQEAVDQLTREL